MDGDYLESKEGRASIDPWRDPQNIAKELKARHQPVDYAQIIGDNRVLFLGEDHSNHAIRDHVASHAVDLKQAGVTHYAIEAKDEGNAVFKRLNNGEAVDLSGVDVGPGREDYELAIRAMARQGIKVVAIDIDQSKKPSKEEREAHMAQKLNVILESGPNEKVAVLIGGNHTIRKYKSEGVESLAQRMINTGVPVVVAQLAGGESQIPRSLLEAAQTAGLANQEFVLDLRPYQDSQYVIFGAGNADLAIHLPQRASGHRKTSFRSLFPQVTLTKRL